MLRQLFDPESGVSHAGDLLPGFSMYKGEVESSTTPGSLAFCHGGILFDLSPLGTEQRFEPGVNRPSRGEISPIVLIRVHSSELPLTR